jgi:hypothetical protein
MRGLPHGFLAVLAKLETARDALGLIANFPRQRLGMKEFDGNCDATEQAESARDIIHD